MDYSLSRAFSRFATALHSGQYVLLRLLFVQPPRLRMRHSPERFQCRPLSLPQLSQTA